MKNKLTDKLFILSFLIIIFVPSLGLFFKRNPEEIRAQLNREPYCFPGVSLRHLGRTDFRGIENWFADQALLVTSLSQLWSGFNYRLGISSKPEKAIVGSNGWLFLGNEHQATIDQYTGKNKPSPEELTVLLNAFKQMNAVAMENHVPFLVVIAPDKHAIYPEYLPEYIKKGSQADRLHLIRKALTANHIDSLDLKKPELQAKKTIAKELGDVYLRCDSHWNFLGAYVAYQAIIQYLQEKNIAVERSTFQFVPLKGTFGDLANFLQLKFCESNSPIPDIKNVKADLWGKDSSGVKKLELLDFATNTSGIITPYQITNKAQKNHLTALLIGDSFSESLNFYFNMDFHKTVRVHNANFQANLADLIKDYHPDVILFEIVERNLYHYANAFDYTSKIKATT